MSHKGSPLKSAAGERLASTRPSLVPKSTTASMAGSTTAAVAATTSKNLLSDNQRMEIQLRQLREELEKEKRERQNKAYSSSTHWRSGGNGALRDGTYKPPKREKPKSKRSSRPGSSKSAASASSKGGKSTLSASSSEQNLGSNVDSVPVDNKPWSVYDATTWKVPSLSKEEESGEHSPEKPREGNSLLDGTYDEEENRHSFQEALREWRTGGASKDEQQPTAGTSTGASTSTSTTTPASASTEPSTKTPTRRPQPKAVDNAAMETQTEGGSPLGDKANPNSDEVKIVYGQVRKTPGTQPSYADRLIEKKRREALAKGPSSSSPSPSVPS